MLKNKTKLRVLEHRAKGPMKSFSSSESTCTERSQNTVMLSEGQGLLLHPTSFNYIHKGDYLTQFTFQMDPNVNHGNGLERHKDQRTRLGYSLIHPSRYQIKHG